MSVADDLTGRRLEARLETTARQPPASKYSVLRKFMKRQTLGTCLLNVDLAVGHATFARHSHRPRRRYPLSTRARYTPPLHLRRYYIATTAREKHSPNRRTSAPHHHHIHHHLLLLNFYPLSSFYPTYQRPRRGRRRRRLPCVPLSLQKARSASRTRAPFTSREILERYSRDRRRPQNY